MKDFATFECWPESISGSYAKNEMLKFCQIRLFLLLIFASVAAGSFGQISDPDMGVLEKSHLPGFIKERKPEVENLNSRNYYLYDSWQLGSIKVIDEEEIENVFFKYDIIRHILEIKFEETIYLLSAKNVSSFYWIDTDKGNLIRFEPVENYYNVTEPMFGFFEVLDEHIEGIIEYKILAYHSVWLYPATTSVSLSGSHKSNDIIWREDYFIAQNGELHKFERRRKENYHLFAYHEEEMKRFIKRKGLSFKTKPGISTIFNYYISLIKDNSN